jgi:uncharacterized repeat protein (TIGR02543 family)
MRKFLSVFIAVCLVLSLFTGVFASLPSARADITEGDYTYTVSGSNATITGYTGSGGAVTIPGTLGGYPVTSIGDSAFNSTKGHLLTSVTIPSSVTSIGNYAFEFCSGLTSVTIPSSVTSIGNYAFEFCSGLTSVTIPSSVTSIGNFAFAYCTGLTSVTIPISVTSIGNTPFLGCSSLTSLIVDPGNPSYSSGSDEVLFNKTVTLVVEYPCGRLGAYVIPSSVAGIADDAFHECTKLTTVTIPNSVTSIGNHAFYGCTGLTNVTIPNSVTSIGNYAFGYCTGLTSVTIPSSVTSIGDYAFAGCRGVTSVTIPNSVTSMGTFAFYGCTKLTTVTIPNSVTSIGTFAFAGCTKLTTVTIPSSVTSIGNDAFAFTGLTAAYFLGNAPTGTTDMFPATGFTVYYVSGTTGWTNPWYGYPTATSVITTYAVTLGTITKIEGDDESTVTIATSPEIAGATVTLTVAPKPGMQLKAGTLVATYNGDVVATLSGAGPYTFTMPAYAVSVTAVFEEIPAYAVTFTVTNGTDRIVGAHVTINETTLTTDGSGVATFSNLADGTYAYGVTALGFNDITGSSVTVAGAAKAVSVTMTAMTAPATDATLRALTSSVGTLSPTFAAGTITYSVVLPNGTTAVPTVTATATDTNATAVVTAAAALPGATTVLVTAQDTTTHQTYTITFTVAAALSSDATLKASSTVKGETLLGLGTPSASGANFSLGGTVTITAAEAANTTNLTSYITLFDPTDAGATVKVVKFSQWGNNGNFDSASAYANQAITNQDYFWVKVTAPDTTTLYYKVNVTVTPAPATDATLSALTSSVGTLDPTFDAATLTYSVVLPAGTTTVPTVTATATDSNATAVVTQATSVTGSATVLVTAQDGTTNQTYTINFTVAAAGTYAVTFDSQGGSAVAAITGITSGATVTLPAAPTKDGYTFASWNTAAAGTGTAFTASTAVTANVTVYAQWTLTPPIPGDISGDGTVGMDDALLLAQSIVGIGTPLTPAQQLAADVNGDGIMSMADTLLIAQIVMGIAH